LSQNQFYNTAKGLIGQDVPLLGAIPLQEEGGQIPSPIRKGDPAPSVLSVNGKRRAARASPQRVNGERLKKPPAEQKPLSSTGGSGKITLD